jgi:hypothetical protein
VRGHRDPTCPDRLPSPPARAFLACTRNRYNRGQGELV